jgi:hypothetical protein
MSGFSKVEMSAFSSDPRYPRGHGDSDHELRGDGEAFMQEESSGGYVLYMLDAYVDR